MKKLLLFLLLPFFGFAQDDLLSSLDSTETNSKSNF